MISFNDKVEECYKEFRTYFEGNGEPQPPDLAKVFADVTKDELEEEIAQVERAIGGDVVFQIYQVLSNSETPDCVDVSHRHIRATSYVSILRCVLDMRKDTQHAPAAFQIKRAVGVN